MAASYQERIRAAFTDPVVTPRLQICPWRKGEEKDIADFLNADGGVFPERQHYYMYDSKGPFDEQRVREEVLPAVRKVEREKPYFELYIRRAADNRIVGMIEFSRDQENRDRVGYYILPSERQHGYAFEAYAACINRAVEKDFLTGDLYAHTSPENTVSQKFLEKAGFRNLGLMTVKNTLNEDQPVIAFTRPLSKDSPVGP